MIKLRLFLVFMILGICTLQGTHSSDEEWVIPDDVEVTHPTQPYTDFNKFYEDLLHYSSELNLPWVRISLTLEGYKETQYYEGNQTLEALREKGQIAQTLISLSKDDLSKFLQKHKRNNLTLSVLEELFYVNLGTIANQICDHFSKSEKLPQDIEILRQIYHGHHLQIHKGQFPEDFLKIAYRVANQANNYAMVEELYILAGIKELENKIKEMSPETFSAELNYIHEPYWSYNIAQLKHYAQRIIEKLRPHIISPDQILKEEESTFITTHDRKKTRVRKIKEGGFGRMLPNLHLGQVLEHNPVLGVPKIFLLPRNLNKGLDLIFHMPYISFFSNMERKDMGPADKPGFNAIQVLCDDFEIFQEYIEGQGVPGDTSFGGLGHLDFNATQVVQTSSGKRYLIDTKESKNFFVPFLSPSPKDRNGKKVSKHREVVFDAKSLNFDPRVIFVKIHLDPINQMLRERH